VRTPGVSVYLAGPKRTNMENFGERRDILIENSPEDNLAGRDRPLETAVQELFKQLGTRPAWRAADPSEAVTTELLRT
jgi:hypothetical protein